MKRRKLECQHHCFESSSYQTFLFNSGLVFWILVYCAFIPVWPAVSASAADSATRIPVLMYHQIDSSQAPSHVIISLELFKQQMEHLKTKNYQTLTLDELTAALEGHKKVSAKSVVLTFDDGWANQLQVLPILRKAGLKAAFFIFPGLGLGYPHMEWNDLYSLSGDPLFEVQAHSMTHPYGEKNNFISWLEGKTAGKSIHTVRGELTFSKEILEYKLGVPVRHLAWPAGIYNNRLIAIAKEIGFKALYTIDPGVNRRRQDIQAIKRIFVNGRCDLSVFAAILQNPENVECNHTGKRIGKLDT